MTHQWIRPIRAVLPASNAICQQMIAPPYDVIETVEARQLARDLPYNFLHLSKPEIDFSDAHIPTVEEIYQHAALLWQNWIAQKKLIVSNTPQYYLYRIQLADREQLGLVCLVSTSAYQDLHIKKHEATRVEKEQDRAHHLRTIKAQVSPVMLAFQNSQAASVLKGSLALATRLFKVSYQNITHELLAMDSAWQHEVAHHMNALENVVIADGHHRFAAAAQVSDVCLSVIFPIEELQILGYHRLIGNVPDFRPDLFLEKLSHVASVAKMDRYQAPQALNEFNCFLSQNWYRCQFLTTDAAYTSVMLQEKVFAPIFQIADPRRDTRLAFIGGLNAITQIESLVQTQKQQVGFALPAVTATQLFECTKRNELLPPKSTWFEPKLLDGLLAYI